MSISDFIEPLLGGALIGVAASLLYAFNGRIAGISGVLGRLVRGVPDLNWRVFFLLGMVGGAIGTLFIAPERLAIETDRSTMSFLLAGIFVGFGTQLGNGCTSGHGVCGLSRLSHRSLTGVLTFMGTAILSVWLINYFWNGHL